MSARWWLILCQWRTQYHERAVFWEPRQAGYTSELDDAGRYSDAEALAIAERMNGGGDRPVTLVPLDDAERFLAERVERAADLPDKISDTAPLRRCDDCALHLGPVLYAIARCPLYGQPRAGVEVRCLSFVAVNVGPRHPRRLTF